MDPSTAIRRTFNTMCILALTSSALHAGSFVLDSSSVSWPYSSDILRDSPGPLSELPRLGVSSSTLGLQPADVIDALSDGHDPVDSAKHSGTMNLIFSVRRPSHGRPGTAVRAERESDTAPPAGGTYGHASDLFLWDGTFDTNSLAPAPLGWSAGTQTGDEYNTHLRIPGQNHRGDNVNGYDRSILRFRTGDGDNPGQFGDPENEVWDPENPEDPEIPPVVGPPDGGAFPPQPIYFSLRTDSPTLAAMGAAPGDVLVVGGAFGPTPRIFVSHASLGIPVDADLDALNLEVKQLAAGLPVVHRMRFSVVSQTAGFALPDGTVVNSGADVLLHDGSTTTRVHRSGELGLRPDDDLDALESVVTQQGLIDQGIVVEPLGRGRIHKVPDLNDLLVEGIGDEGRDGVSIEFPAAMGISLTIRGGADIQRALYRPVRDGDCENAGTDLACLAPSVRIDGESGAVGFVPPDGLAALIAVLSGFRGDERVESFQVDLLSASDLIQFPPGPASDEAALRIETFLRLTPSGDGSTEMIYEFQSATLPLRDGLRLETPGAEVVAVDRVQCSLVVESPQLGVLQGPPSLVAAEVTAATAVGSTGSFGIEALTVHRGFRRGDADGSGEVDISDVIGSLAWMFLGEGQIDCRDAADSDDNGQLDISDPIQSLAYLFLGTFDIPAPGAKVCGADPTGDRLGCARYESCRP